VALYATKDDVHIVTDVIRCAHAHPWVRLQHAYIEDVTSAPQETKHSTVWKAPLSGVSSPRYDIKNTVVFVAQATVYLAAFIW
jgi:hypothetical protein